MNHIYKVVFCKTTGTFVAVAEYARAHGKNSNGTVGSVSDTATGVAKTGKYLMFSAISSAMLLMSGNVLAANPTGIQTSSTATGSSTITQVTGGNVCYYDTSTNLVCGNASTQTGTATNAATNAIALGSGAIASSANDVFIGNIAGAGFNPKGNNSTTVNSSNVSTVYQVINGVVSRIDGTALTPAEKANLYVNGKAVQVLQDNSPTGLSLQTATNNNVGIGNSVGLNSTGQNNIMMGNGAANTMYGTDTISIGTNSNNFSNINNGSITSAFQSVAIGKNTLTNGQSGVAIGNNATIRPGTSAYSGTTADNAIAIGNNAITTAYNGIAMGNSANARIASDISIGAGAGSAVKQNYTAGNQLEASIAIGQNAGANSYSNDFVVIGNNSGQGSGTSLIAHGDNTTVGSGSGNNVQGDTNTVIGWQSGNNIGSNSNVAIGPRVGSNVSGANNVTMVISSGNFVKGGANVSLGNGSGNYVGVNDNATSLNATTNVFTGTGVQQQESNGNIAIGAMSGRYVSGSNNFAFGETAGNYVNYDPTTKNLNPKNGNMAFGQNAGSYINGSNNITMGANAGKGTASTAGVLLRDSSLNFGTNATAYSNDSIAMGTNSVAGVLNTPSVANGIAIGKGAQAIGNQSISIGTGNVVNAKNSGAIGDPTIISANSISGTGDVDGSYSIGNNNYINSSNTFILGNNVNKNGATNLNSIANSVYLGNGSIVTDGTGTMNTATGVTNQTSTGGAGTTTTAGANGNLTSASTNTTGGTLTYNGFAGTQSYGAVSVGAAGSERRIQNVAAGQITATSTDAINGSQLYAIADKLGGQVENTYFHVGTLKNTGTGNATTNLGSITDAAGAVANGSITAGTNATVTSTGNNAISMGSGAIATGSGSVAIGNQSGQNTDSTSFSNISIGEFAGKNVKGAYNSAVGTSGSGVLVTGNYNTAMGHTAGRQVTGSSNSAFGTTAGQVVIGSKNTAVGNQSGQNVYGSSNLSAGDNSGQYLGNTNTSVINNIALGIQSGNATQGNNNIFMGVQAGDAGIYDHSKNPNWWDPSNNATATKSSNTIALGTSAWTGADNAIAIGKGAQATGSQSISVGTGNIVTGDNSGAFGDPNTIGGAGSYAFGNNNTIAQNNTFVLGTNVTTTQANSVTLGNASTDRAATTESSATINGVSYGAFAGQGSAAKGIVSVGSVGGERQLINVAAGNISATSTDAINGSQLYLVAKGTLDQLPVVYTDATGNKVVKSPNGNFYPAGTPLDAAGNPTNGAAPVSNVIASMNSPTGSTTTVTKLTNVAPATLSPTSTDAVNGSQLYSTNQNVANNTTAINNINSQVSNTFFHVNNGQGGGDAATNLGKITEAAGAVSTGAVTAGTGTTANGYNTTAIGSSAKATGDYSSAFGNGSVATSNTATGFTGATAVGAATWAQGDNATSIGSNAGAYEDRTTTVGSQSYAVAKDATTVGYGSIAAQEGSVALGSGSVANRAAITGVATSNTADAAANTVYALDNTNAADKAAITATAQSTKGAISIGDTDGSASPTGTPSTRQLTGLAAGSNDTDAVNVAQLKGVANTARTTVTSSNNSIKVVDNNNGVGNLAYDIQVNNQGLVNNTQLPVVYTDNAGNKVYLQPNGTFNTAADGSGTNVPNTSVIASMQNADGKTNIPTTLANVASNLPTTYNTDAYNTNGSPVTTSQTLPTGANVNNAATVGDVLNSGWNLQGNGAAKDFVKAYDTVNFIDGKGTKATVTPSADGTSNTVTYDVATDGVTTTTNPAGQVTVVTAPITSTGGIASTTGNPNSLATAGDVVNAVNTARTTVKSTDGSISVVDTNNGTGNLAYDIKVNNQAITNGAQLPVVYTDNAGNKVYLVNGAFNTAPDGSGTNVPNTNIIASMQNPDGTVSTQTKLTNVAPATLSPTSTDAVNGSQLYATNQNVAANTTAINANTTNIANNTAAINKGTVYAGDTTTGATNAFTRQLGDQTNIVGGAKGTLTDNNIGVVSNGTDTLTVKLAKDINLGTDGSVTTGNTVVNNTGVTINTTDPTKTVSLTSGGLNNGGNVISNVGAGVKADDAVNVSQLQAAQAASTTKVAAGTGTTVTNTPNTDGSTTYTVSAKTDGTTITTNGAGALTAVTSPLTTNTNGSVNTPAAPNALATAGDVANAINNSGFNLTAQGANSSMVKPGSTVDMKNTDGNIVVSKNATDNTVNYDLAKNVKVDSVSINNSNVSLGNTGLNNGGNTISNLGSGGNVATNAANIGDVQNARTTLQSTDNSISVVNTAAAGSPNFAYDIKVNNQGITNGSQLPVVYTNTNGDKVYKVGDNFYTNPQGTGTPVDTGSVIASMQNAAGSTTSPTKLTNIAPATLSSTSTDAVNGSQLYATNQQVANNTAAIGKGINFGGTTGSNNYQLGDTMNVKGDSNISSTTVAGGVQLALARDINVNSVTAGNTVLSTTGLNNGGNTITNVAAGVNATDAVNVSQLNNVKSVIGIADGQTTPNIKVYNVADRDTKNNVTVVDAINHMNNEGIQYFHTNGADTNAIRNEGATHDASAEAARSTAIGVKATVGKDARDGIAIGTGATVAEKAANAVALGAGSVAKQTPAQLQATPAYTPRGTRYDAIAGTGQDVAGEVSVGDTGATRRLTNLAAGAMPTDAVNVSQLAAVDDKVNHLGYKLGDVEDNANAGISGAMAMAALPQAYLPGKSMLAGGMATYNGEGAVAIGVSKLSDNGRWVIKVNGTADTRGNAGAAVGAGFHW